VSAGSGTAENTASVQALLGDLELARGRVGPAARAYRQALALVPRYAAADAGLARAEAARGDLPAAIRRLSGVVARLPLPQYVVALGEAELAAGRRSAARRDLALVAAEQRLLATNGVDTDVDVALFEADHGSPAHAVALARRAWAQAPSVRSADALGWALTRAGHPRDGQRWAHRALRLHSRDAMFLYHAGMTARAAGDGHAARRWLRRALATSPRFSPLYAPRAARALRELGR
jgi:tetratricopeptide (TPR) repeat protein